MSSRLLPPSSNAQYTGATWAARLLAVLAVLTIVPGAIHSFLPDGGAGSIAGLDLETGGAAIVALFHWAGPTQVAFGAMMLAAALRYRPLVPLLFALLLFERGVHALHAWAGGAPPSGHRPPEHYAVLVALPLIAVGLRASLRGRARARSVDD